MNDDTGGTKSVAPPLLTPEMARDVLHFIEAMVNLNLRKALVIVPGGDLEAIRALAEGRTVCVSVDGAVTSKTVSHGLSVRASVAEPTESAIIFGFESASDFEDSRLYKLLSGCRGAALRARITWRAMNEDRRVEVDEWWRMLTDADWESLGEIPDDDDESFAEYQARIAATEARTLGGEREIECDHAGETKSGQREKV